MLAAMGDGTRESPWVLKTPSGGSEYEMFRDESLDPPALVCRVGKTELRYHLRCLDDLEAMLRERGDWVPLGSADEQKPAVMEALGRAEVEHNARNNRMRALKRYPPDPRLRSSAGRALHS